LAIDKSGTWWVGSDTSDIESYLIAFTEPPDGGYSVAAYRAIRCKCGGDPFILERALDIARRSCPSCGAESYTCRSAGDWEEAADEEKPETFECVECKCAQANIGVGFAPYQGSPELDAVKWFYVGVRCVDCGVLGCFADGKVGWGPAAEVYRQA
jgi:hypothetical protein